jgi:aryl-alcohol dehydrogenase-like predicted oxidoreductase
LQFKHLGRTGLKVSRLSIGGAAWGFRVKEPEAIKLIQSALAEGLTFVDTSDMYGKESFLSPDRGQSEIIVGKAIKEHRHDLILATKVGGRAGPTANDIGLSRWHIMDGVEQQLRRLQTDYIDLYYAHIFDNTTPIEETLRAMDDLVHQGKVRYIGCSNYYAWQLCKALWISDQNNLARYDCIQLSYNLLSRDIETELLPLCASEGIGVNIWGPLAGGLLSGKYDKFNADEPPPPGAFGYGMWSQITHTAISRLMKVANESGHTMTQLALAWLLNNPIVTSVLTGFTSVEQLKENVSSLDVELTEDEIKACDEVGKMIYPMPKMFHPTVVEAERLPADEVDPEQI